MPRKKKEVKISEEEILNRPIDTTGNDPNPAVNALMSEEFIQMSNFDASQIALVLQQIVRGQNSLLAMAKENSEEIIRLKERQERIDKEAAARHAAQKDEIADILNKAEKLKAKGDKKDKIIATGVKQYQKAVQNARASKTVDRLAFEKKLAAEPQEYVVAHGQLVTTIENGQQVAKILPEEIRIKHKVWYLQPGVPTKVPASVAATLRARYASQEQTNKLKDMLSKQMHANKLAQEWNAAKGAGSMPIVPG
jgi:hypothetical protein